jgi:accessory gene regulator protein AgrB
MVRKISFKIANLIYKKSNKFSHYDRFKLYYVMQYLIFNILEFLLIITLSCVFKIFIETSLVLLSFVVIGRFKKSYHASSYLMCSIFSISGFLILGKVSQIISLNTNISFIITSLIFGVIFSLNSKFLKYLDKNKVV